MPTGEAVVKLNSSEKPMAFYYAIETILNFKEFKCHVSFSFSGFFFYCLFSQHAEWILNKIGNTFNRTFIG